MLDHRSVIQRVYVAKGVVAAAGVRSPNIRLFLKMLRVVSKSVNKKVVANSNGNTIHIVLDHSLLLCEAPMQTHHASRASAASTEFRYRQRVMRENHQRRCAGESKRELQVHYSLSKSLDLTSGVFVIWHVVSLTVPRRTNLHLGCGEPIHSV